MGARRLRSAAKPRRGAPPSTSRRSTFRVRAASGFRSGSGDPLRPRRGWVALQGGRATLGPDRGAEGICELVDLRAGAALGDRDEQAAIVLGVLAAKRVSGCDAALRAAVEDRPDGSVEANRELAHDRRLVDQLDAVDRAQPLARVGGALNQQLAQLAEAAAAEPGEVDHRAERVQGLRGADVVGRLLAADVLLARLQGEDEAAAPVDILGFAGDSA